MGKGTPRRGLWHHPPHHETHLCCTGYGNLCQRGTKHRSEQLAHLSDHEIRDLWLRRTQIEASVSHVTELTP